MEDTAQRWSNSCPLAVRSDPQHWWGLLWLLLVVRRNCRARAFLSRQVYRLSTVVLLLQARYRKQNSPRLTSEADRLVELVEGLLHQKSEAVSY